MNYPERKKHYRICVHLYMRAYQIVSVEDAIEYLCLLMYEWLYTVQRSSYNILYSYTNHAQPILYTNICSTVVSIIYVQYIYEGR